MDVSFEENYESQASTASVEEPPYRLISISDLFQLKTDVSYQSAEGQPRRKKYKDRFCFRLGSGLSANVYFQMKEIVEENESSPSKMGINFVIKSCEEEYVPIQARNPRDFTYSDFVCLAKLTFLHRDSSPAFVRYFNTGGTESNQTLSLFEKILLTDMNFCSGSSIHPIIQKSSKRGRGGVVKEQEFISMKMDLLIRVPNNSSVTLSHTDCHMWRRPCALKLHPPDDSGLGGDGTVTGTVDPSRSLTSKMKTDDKHTDTVFLVENERIKAHVAVLAAASDVFAKIFHDRWSGSLNEFDGMKEIPVSLNNVTAESFKIFLDLIYDHNLALHAHNSFGNLQSLELANYYHIDHVRDVCIKNLVFMENENFTITTGLHLFATGRQHNIPDLEFRANQWLSDARKKSLLKSPEGRKEIADLISENGDMLHLVIVALTA